MPEKTTDTAKRDERQLTRTDPFVRSGNPVQMLERFADEMDRVFDDFGLGRGWLTPRPARSWLRSPERSIATGFGAWSPEVEVFYRNNELVVQADLPSLNKNDVKVDVTEDAVTIQGERKHEHKEEREGVYRSERSYGSFCRVIPLPEGALTDQAKAHFKDGVLEVTMPAPPEEVRRGRRLEISEDAKK